MEEDLRPTFYQRLPVYPQGSGAENPHNTSLIAEHYHPVQHTLRGKRNKKLRVHFLQYNLAHKTPVSFPKVQNFVFFGSIVYKEHLCLNTKD